MVETNQVFVLTNLGRIREAQELGLQVLARQRRTFGAGSPELVAPLNLVADALRQTDRIDEALALHREALSIASKLDPEGLEAGWGHSEVGSDLITKVEAGERDVLAQADAEAKLAMAAFRRVEGREPSPFVYVLALSGRVALAQGDAPAARSLFEEALDQRRRQAGDDDVTTAQIELFLGLTLQRLGERSEATRWLESSYATLRAHKGADDRWTRRAKAALSGP